MRILELQRRLREVGRIRIGAQVATSNGKTRPGKLEHFRFTSRDRRVIESAAEQWGGTAQEWTDAPDGGQWEVFTDATEVPVVIPPGDMAFSQAYEQWTAGGCKVRCDGQRDHIADADCHCDPEQRECAIHTRLSVILPDLPGMGVWRLDTQGYYAAVELGGLVDLVASFTERGVMLPARLRLEQRSVKRPKARGSGVETRRFVVPVLDVDVNPLALTGQSVSIGAPGTEALPAANLTPVPQLDLAELSPPVAEQVAQIDEPKSRKGRANAAEPIPATGLKPRTVAEVEAPAEPQLELADPGVEMVTAAQLRKLGAACTEAGLTDRDTRLQWASKIVGRELGSSKELTKDEASKVIDALEKPADSKAGLAKARANLKAE